jgi:hypothetical protein
VKAAERQLANRREPSPRTSARFALPSTGRSHGVRWRMAVGDWLKKIFAAPNAAPPEPPKLPGTSEKALASALQSLPRSERGWITLAEAARLFSPQQPDYAFGEMDDVGNTRLAQFAEEHRCSPQFMPAEGRLYFTRSA